MFFSKIQDIVTFYFKNKSIFENIKTTITTIMHMDLDFSIFQCENH